MEWRVKKDSKKKKKTYKRIELTTRKCEKEVLTEPPYFVCSCCGTITSTGYRYKESSIGAIVLCASCNNFLRKPKDGKVNLVYTAFESSRTKH